MRNTVILTIILLIVLLFSLSWMTGAYGLGLPSTSEGNLSGDQGTSEATEPPRDDASPFWLLERIETHLVVRAGGEWEGTSTLCITPADDGAVIEAEMERRAETLWGTMGIQYRRTAVSEEKLSCYAYSLIGHDLNSLIGAAFTRATMTDWLGGPMDFNLTGSLGAGETLELVLPSNPTTGYIWEVALPTESSSVQVEADHFRQLSPLLGAPGLQIIRLRAADPQLLHLRLHYRRPWQADVPPSRVLSIDAKELGLGELEPVLSDWPERTPPTEGTIQWDDRFSFGQTSAPLPEPSSLSSSSLPGQLPSAFNWCDQGGCTSIKDQGACGSCWAFATVGLFESALRLRTGITRDLSEQYLVSCNMEGWSCNGGDYAHDYHWWKKRPSVAEAGAALESDFPYQAAEPPCTSPPNNPFRINSWAYVGGSPQMPSVTAIKQAIYERGPVAAALCVGPAFVSYTSGVFSTDESSECPLYPVNHAIVLVGWDDSRQAWRLRNSWGAGWGESGYMWIRYGTSKVGYETNYISYTPNRPQPPGQQKVYLPLVLRRYFWPAQGPGAWQTIVYETFEGSFPTGAWEVLDNNGTSHGQYYWARRSCRAYQGSYSAWAVGGGAQGSGLSCGSNYPNNADSWMIYGPFSLADATDAELSFQLWLNSESGYDSVCWYASTDGDYFYGRCETGNTGGWKSRRLDLMKVPTLGNLVGQPKVWIALRFVSDDLYNYPEGAYVDNLLLRKYVGAPPTPRPYTPVPLTLTPNVTPTPGGPTPTPTPSGWEILVSTDFEGQFPGPWDVFDDDGTTNGEYYWGKRNCRAYQGTYSGWAIGAGAHGAALSCGSNYPNYARSSMMYGPFSLEGATAAGLTFKLWLNTESQYDYICRMASIGGDFYGLCTHGSSGGWIDRTLDLSNVPTLGNLLGQPQVWVLLWFYSDSSITYPEGGYVDNVVLRRCPQGATCATSNTSALPPGSRIKELPAHIPRSR